jgi:endoribonuclease LACTB2
VSHIVRAASVLLSRGVSAAEYFLVERARHLRFMGGYHAFPGGKVAAEDSKVPVRRNDSPAAAEPGDERIVAAARELFEETGALIARTKDGSYPPSGSKLDYLRRKMAEENLPFEQVLARLSLELHADDFHSVGHLVTPPFVPYRFDSRFFLARLPESQTPEIWPGELVSAAWRTAEDALAAWRVGECLVSPPTVAILEAVVGLAWDRATTRLRELLSQHADSAHPPIYVAPQVKLLPLFTDSLPPTTHTNAYLIGNERVYLLDPGTDVAEERAVLFETLDEHLASGCILTAVVLSHHHPDHVGAAKVCAERYRIPIYAHELTQQRLAGQVAIDHLLAEGDRLNLGTTPDGRASWFLEALETPGHADGHLVFWDPYYRLLFAGDMVSTVSSVVIAPPEGDLNAYLKSLARLRGLESRLLLPSHGGPNAAPDRAIDECIAHRKQREEQLLAALDSTPRSVSELAQLIYKGLAPKMMRFAELQLLAGLYKLRQEGRAISTAENIWMAGNRPT